MPKTARTPSYRHHRASNQAVVSLNGRDVYLGRYDSPESKARYHQIIAEWHASGRAAPPRAAAGDPAADLTIDELILRFWRHAEQYYRHPDGTPTGELANYRDSLRPLRKLYGATPAAQFGPLRLKACRDEMIRADLARSEINKRIGRIVRVFKFGVECELLPPSSHHALRSVPGLRAGRTEARESEPVRPVEPAAVEAILPHVARPVRAMIELQLWTAMRPGEVVAMKGSEIDTSGPVWSYKPRRHKTSHRGRERCVYIGPRAQEILRPWLRDDPDQFLFSPAEAVAEHQAAKRARRKSKVQPSQRDRRKPRRRRPPGGRYETRTYAHAIKYACDRAFPHPTLARVKRKDLTAEQRAELAAWRKAHRWHPHQLRHTAASRLRKEHGIEVARIVLGHSQIATAEIYAVADEGQAVAAMAAAG